MAHLGTILIILVMALLEEYVTEGSITDYLQNEEAEFAFFATRNGHFKDDVERPKFLASARVIEEYRQGNRVSHILMNEVPVLKQKRLVEIKDCNRVLNLAIMEKILGERYKYNINQYETRMYYKNQVSVEIKIIDSDLPHKTYSYEFTQFFSVKCPAISVNDKSKSVLIYLSKIAELESGNAHRYTFVYKDSGEKGGPVQVLALINNKILYDENEFDIFENSVSLNEVIESTKKVNLKNEYVQKAHEPPTLVISTTSDIDYSVKIIKKLKYYSIDSNADSENDKKIYKEKAEKKLGKIPFALPKEYLVTAEIYFIYLTSLYGFVSISDKNQEHIVKSIERIMSYGEHGFISESPFTIPILKASSELFQSSVCSRIITLWQMPLDLQLFQIVDDTASNQITLEKKQIEFSSYHSEFNNLISQNVIKCPPLPPKKGLPNRRSNIYFHEVLLKDQYNETELTIVYTDVETEKQNAQEKETLQEKETDPKNNDINNSNDNSGKIKIVFSLSNEALDYKGAVKDFLKKKWNYSGQTGS